MISSNRCWAIAVMAGTLLGADTPAPQGNGVAFEIHSRTEFTWGGKPQEWNTIARVAASRSAARIEMDSRDGKANLLMLGDGRQMVLLDSASQSFARFMTPVGPARPAGRYGNGMSGLALESGYLIGFTTDPRADTAAVSLVMLRGRGELTIGSAVTVNGRQPAKNVYPVRKGDSVIPAAFLETALLPEQPDTSWVDGARVTDISVGIEQVDDTSTISGHRTRHYRVRESAVVEMRDWPMGNGWGDTFPRVKKHVEMTTDNYIATDVGRMLDPFPHVEPLLSGVTPTMSALMTGLADYTPSLLRLQFDLPPASRVLMSAERIVATDSAMRAAVREQAKRLPKGLLVKSVLRTTVTTNEHTRTTVRTVWLEGLRAADIPTSALAIPEGYSDRTPKGLLLSR